MLELGKTQYRLIFMDESGKEYNITDYVGDLGWEELEKEMACRISFNVLNDNTSKGKLSSLLKSGCLCAIFATMGTKKDEVARGYLVDWTTTLSNSDDTLAGKCYDSLYNLQESSDNLYFTDGTGTKTIITTIFNNWGITDFDYQGPDVQHSKLAYKSENLSTMLTETLEDARKKGGNRCFICERKGRIKVIPYSTNKEIYHFDATVSKSLTHKRSTDGMVTRVKIIGQADDDGRSSTEAVIDGQTKYGIRQKVITQGKDDTLDNAKKDAQDELDNNGQIIETITLNSPDIPFIHKGDLVHCTLGTISGWYNVVGISHDAEAGTMSMSLHTEYKVKEETNSAAAAAPAQKQYNVGDVVNFHGGTHYVSSYPGSKGYSVSAGPATIKIKNGSGKAHPWCLVTTDWSKTHVWGWVDDGTFD